MKKWIDRLGWLAIIGIVAWAVRLEVTVNAHASEIQQTAINQRELIKLTSKVNSELDLLFKLGAIDQEWYENLRTLPASPIDENGNAAKQYYILADSVAYLITIPEDCEVIIKEIPIG